MKKLIPVLTVLFTVILLSANSFAQQWTSEQKDVWAGVEKYWEASASGNAAEFMKYFDDSYMGWDNQSQVPMDKDNTGKWVEYGLKNNTTVAYTLSPLTIWVKGDFAYVHYYYAEVDKNKETGKNENSSGNWTDILMNEGGVWKLIGDHGGRTSKPSGD
jgi:ketosteroid isomerase-like protein